MERRDLLRRMVQTGMLAGAGGFVLLSAQILGPSPASSASPDSLVHLRLLDRLDQMGMRVAGGGHRDAGAEIEVSPAIRRVQIRSLAALERDVESCIARHDGWDHDSLLPRAPARLLPITNNSRNFGGGLCPERSSKSSTYRAHDLNLGHRPNANSGRISDLPKPNEIAVHAGARRIAAAFEDHGSISLSPDGTHRGR